MCGSIRLSEYNCIIGTIAHVYDIKTLNFFSSKFQIKKQNGIRRNNKTYTFKRLPS